MSEDSRPAPPLTAVPSAANDALVEADRVYYLARAEEELELAQRARHEKVVYAHYLLAGLYLDRVYGSGPGDGAQ